MIKYLWKKERDYFLFLSVICVLIKMHSSAAEGLPSQGSPQTSRGWALPIPLCPSLALAVMALVSEVAHQTPGTSLLSPAQTFRELDYKHLHGDVL